MWIEPIWLQIVGAEPAQVTVRADFQKLDAWMFQGSVNSHL